MPSGSDSLGRSEFAERHGLWSEEKAEAAERALALIEQHRLETVRLSFPDQHGLLRGKSIEAAAFRSALRNGVAMVTTLLAKDTAHRTVYPVFTKGGGFGLEEMTGGGDFVMLPDPAQFRVLPWAPGTGWVLCDIYFPNGKPVPFATRDVLRRAAARLGEKGYDFVAGLEVEFHIFKLENPRLLPEDATQPAAAPEVSLLARGFHYLTETRFDEVEPALMLLRRNLVALGLPVRSFEIEYGPSQCEITFHPGAGLEPADAMVLFRSAAKQVARRHGYHVTFMCQPALANLFPSGWHLHQSLRERATGRNAFMPERAADLLSPLGRHFVAGLIRHARAASVFAAPTINAYKRYRPNSLAPDRAAWSRDNRGVMLRVIGGPGEATTRIENRIGEPAANPYLYMASQILAGLDGIARGAEPPPPTETPYDNAAAERLPLSLMEAVAALKADAFFREALGAGFVDYIVHLKEAEIARFLATVTDWEQREYFELY
jgi:glutamine synthetase